MKLLIIFLLMIFCDNTFGGAITLSELSHEEYSFDLFNKNIYYFI